MNDGTAISISGVSKTFTTPYAKVRALDRIHLEIPRGSFYGLVGFSGAGKSTLLRCINRLETPDEGSIVIDGKDVARLENMGLVKHRRRVGMIFQQFNLFDSRTVAGNIAFPLEVEGRPKKIIKARVAEMASLVGLTHKLGAYPGSLSGGQKQRVGIARALAAGPDILLSDEATSALDPHTTLSILELLRRLNQEMDLTIVLVTHELDVVRAVCGEMAIMDEGAVVEQGTVEKIFHEPISETGRRFVGITRDFQRGTLFRLGDGI